MDFERNWFYWRKFTLVVGVKKHGLVLRFYILVNSYGHVETVSSPNHTFTWASLTKWLTRGEFNNASLHGRSLFWYLSLCIMCKAWHQYNERSRALASFNSPL